MYKTLFVMYVLRVDVYVLPYYVLYSQPVRYLHRELIEETELSDRKSRFHVELFPLGILPKNNFYFIQTASR